MLKPPIVGTELSSSMWKWPALSCRSCFPVECFFGFRFIKNLDHARLYINLPNDS